MEPKQVAANWENTVAQAATIPLKTKTKTNQTHTCLSPSSAGYSREVQKTRERDEKQEKDTELPPSSELSAVSAVR